MATIATILSDTNPVAFDDTFRTLNDDLNEEARDWHLDNYHIPFDPKMFTNEPDDVVPQEMPDYLLPSNLSFQTAFFSELRNLYQPIAFEDLQQLAFLVHQLTIIHLHQQLWQRFLQCGTGQIRPHVPHSRLPQSSHAHPDDGESTLAVWPAIVVSAAISQGFVQGNEINPRNVYLPFVRNYLDQLDKQAKQYRLLFDTMKRRVPEYTSTLGDKLDRFVQREGIEPTRLHFETHMALLEYTFVDRTHQLDYIQQKPTDSQLQIAKQMCSLTFEKEKAQQEMVLLKFGVLFSRLPRSLNILEASVSPTITSISDRDTRERLSNEYCRVIQEAKADLASVLVRAAQARKFECHTKFDEETAAIWTHQRSLLPHERLSKAMLDTLEQRQRNIIGCVKRIYVLKEEFFLRAPPLSKATATTVTT